jgi:hypothetical protein
LRARWLWSHSVFVAIVTSAAVGAVAPLLSISVSAESMLVDVMTSIVRASIIDETLLHGNCFLSSRWRLLMNRYLPLVSGWLDALFRGCPSTSRG